MDFTRYPKVELHLHLDCSISYAAARALQPGLSEQAYRERFVAPAKCRDLTDFLARAQAGVNLLQSRQALSVTARELMRLLAEDGVIYAEIRFAPLLHTRKGLSGQEVVDTVLQALQDSPQAGQVQTQLILCTLRSFSEAQGVATAQLAEQYHGQGVCGYDIAGDEASYPLEPHVAGFHYAYRAGIPSTAHAGEARGPESVRQSLRELQLQRIGHGVRISESEEVYQQVRRSGIHLEVCPTSNIQTDIYESMEQHAINRLYRDGFPLSVNTDGRSLCGVSLTDEYRKLQQAFGWGQEELLRCNLYAVDAAFTDDATKDRLRQQLREGWAK